MLIADVKRLVQYRTGVKPSAQFTDYLAAAISEYSRWNPRILEGSVTTIANTSLYSLASLTGLIGIKEVRYFSGYTLGNEVNVTSENIHKDSQPERYYLWSQRIIDDIEENESVKAGRGYVYYRQATNQIKLASLPSASGETITIYYYAPHVINVGGTGYDTIPAEDLNIIRDLVLAEFYQDDAFDAAMQPDYKEGQESETFSRVSGNISDVVARLRSSVAIKYSAAVLDVGP
jgi:hypothetical protein